MGMDLDKSTRKPYIRPVKANWWTNKGFYIAYMLREGTSVLVLLFILELLYLFALMAGINDIPGAFEAGKKAQEFVQCPLVIILNILVLIATIYHAVTWFALMPKAQRLFIGNKLVDGKYTVYALYAITILVTIFGGICFFTDFLWIFLK